MYGHVDDKRGSGEMDDIHERVKELRRMEEDGVL